MITLTAKQMDDVSIETAKMEANIELCRKLLGAKENESLHDVITSVIANIMNEREVTRKLHCSLAEMVAIFNRRTFNPSYALDELARAHEALKLSRECKGVKRKTLK